MIKPEHNHPPTLAGAPVHRRMAMTLEIKSEITRALTVQTAPSEVFSSLRMPNSTTGVNWDEGGNPVIVNPLFKPRDIYNFKTQMRRDALSPLTPFKH